MIKPSHNRHTTNNDYTSLTPELDKLIDTLLEKHGLFHSESRRINCREEIKILISNIIANTVRLLKNE